MKPYSPFLPAVVFAAILLSSCTRTTNTGPNTQIPAKVEGWVPIYADKAVSDIKSVDPVAIVKGGKIYIKGSVLYQVETARGIHVIDISQPDNPKKLKFINIPGAQEMAIKDNFLYANNLNDLVVLDISNLTDAKLVTRAPSMFNIISQSLPPSSGYFECVEASKGIVVGWESKNLEYPKCRKN